MQDQHQCGRCGAALPTSTYYLRMRWDKATACRCKRCGCTHSILRGQVEVISPPMYPVDQYTKVSPWYPSHTRPVTGGNYECRFSHVEPRVFKLYWNGRDFLHEGSAVSLRNFLGWRGSWAS